MPLRSDYVPSNNQVTEARIKFDTYRFYLNCVCQHLITEYSNWEGFVSLCIQQTRSLQGMQQIDHRWIDRFMKIAWNTEYLLYLDARDPEILRINNQWTPIQSYFAVYAACEALSYVIDGTKSDGHQKAIRKATHYFVNSGLSPWNKAYQGCLGRRRSSHLPLNFPRNFTIPHNLRRSNIDPVGMTARCLRAEHIHRVDDQWDRRRPRGTRKHEIDPGCTSLLHFLYRLRIKSNYEEINIFVSDAPEVNIRDFTNCLRQFCTWTISYIEVILMRKCTKRLILDLSNAYLSVNPRATDLKARMNYYKRTSFH